MRGALCTVTIKPTVCGNHHRNTVGVPGEMSTERTNRVKMTHPQWAWHCAGDCGPELNKNNEETRASLAVSRL